MNLPVSSAVTFADSLAQIRPDKKSGLKPQLHCHDFGHDGATTHPDLSSRDASA